MFDAQGDIPENGFNRYMVECEYNLCICRFTGYGLLIDTWWNVNAF